MCIRDRTSGDRWSGSIGRRAGRSGQGRGTWSGTGHPASAAARSVERSSNAEAKQNGAHWPRLEFSEAFAPRRVRSIPAAGEAEQREQRLEDVVEVEVDRQRRADVV